MSTPVLESLAELVVERLEEITTENGYSIDAESVDRPSKLSWDNGLRERSILVMQGDSLRVPELDCPGNPPAVAYSVQFNIHGIRRPDDLDQTPYMTAVNELDACIRKALTTPDRWHNFGGVAIDADCGDPSPFQSPEGDHVGVTIPLRIVYRISENDPYTSRA